MNKMMVVKNVITIIVQLAMIKINVINIAHKNV